MTSAAQGVRKGEPRRFCQGHANRGRKLGPRPAEVRARISAANKGHRPAPSAYAHWVGAGLRGPDARNWRGGIVRLGRYRGIYSPEHPRAYRNGYVYEHILVAEQAVGRALTDGEVVHHLDHDPLNNTPGNLVVVKSHSEHIRRFHPHGRPHPKASMPLPS